MPSLKIELSALERYVDTCYGQSTVDQNTYPKSVENFLNLSRSCSSLNNDSPLTQTNTAIDTNASNVSFSSPPPSRASSDSDQSRSSERGSSPEMEPKIKRNSARRDMIVDEVEMKLIAKATIMMAHKCKMEKVKAVSLDIIEEREDVVAMAVALALTNLQDKRNLTNQVSSLSTNGATFFPTKIVFDIYWCHLLLLLLTFCFSFTPAFAAYTNTFKATIITITTGFGNHIRNPSIFSLAALSSAIFLNILILQCPLTGSVLGYNVPSHLGGITGGLVDKFISLAGFRVGWSVALAVEGCLTVRKLMKRAQ